MAASMAGSFASVAGTAAMKDVGQAIGKPLEALSSVGTRPTGHSEINWVNFNYPPLLRLVHYDLEELPSTLTGLVRRLNWSFQLTTISCALNFIDNLIIVLSTRAPARWLLQSLLHFVMLPMFALAVFYAGYRGLAEPDASLLKKYKISQPILAVFYFLLSLVDWGCANGLFQLMKIHEHSDDGSVFWTVVIFLESFLWGVNFLFATLNLYRAHTFDQFATGAGVGAGGGGTRF
eukprot:TRINITY_DN22606_c0_g2_i1.p1 TRINITY_DN22606_c0_g2~~TRINITY_DN22606_c0_g2_i1.p1  ORF type:complete len:234 (+),score=28.16 TRINITY_DN22606_c0_g2_i1:66-767(+)